MSVTRVHNLSISLHGFATGTAGVDDAFAVHHGPGIGAEIMGADKFVWSRENAT